MVNILKSILGRRIGFDATTPNANLVIEGGLIMNNNTVPTTIGGGTLSTNVTAKSSAATNTTQTLDTYTIPANTLKSNGNGIVVTAFGHYAGNAAPKTLQLTIGGKNINTGSITQSGTTWILKGNYTRLASDSQVALFTAQVGTVFITPTSTTDTSVDTGTIGISVTMTDASAATGNVVQDGMLVTNF
jgi:hypothetical protein